MKKLFLIDFESQHWCGGQSHVVVHAETADEASYLAESHMEDAMRELFSQEIEEDAEEGGEAGETSQYTINSIEEFGPEHEDWQFFCMPDQRHEFYPEVGGSYFDE